MDDGDPVFVLLGGHEPPWTKRAVVAATGGAISGDHWRDLRRGRANWAEADLRAIAPLVGQTAAALARQLHQRGRYVRPDALRHSPRNSCPRPRPAKRASSRPSALASDRAA